MQGLQVDPTWCRRNGIAPHTLYTPANGSGRYRLVVLRSATGNDFALAKSAIDFLVKASIPADIVLYERDLVTVVTKVSLDALAVQLRGVAPRQGHFGLYYWLTPEGQPAPSYAPPPQVPGDDQIPF